MYLIIHATKMHEAFTRNMNLLSLGKEYKRYKLEIKGGLEQVLGKKGSNASLRRPFYTGLTFRTTINA